VIDSDVNSSHPPTSAPSLPRLLAGVGAQQRWVKLARHRSRYPIPPLPGNRPVESYISAVENAGLRGRGGGAFPTGRKMRAVSVGRTRPIVVINGSEGEPASRKDEMLLRYVPHLVLDGALVSAAAIGADQVIICIDRNKASSIRAVDRAVVERFGVGEPTIAIHVEPIPTTYVAGEETALVHFLNGGEARPTLTPPRPFEKGVDSRPTLIINVETSAHVAQIIRWGPHWFREQGTNDEPGTMLVTLSGDVTRGGVFEVPVGAPIATILRTAGSNESFSAVLLGGYYGTWLSAEVALSTTLDQGHLRPVGSGVGCGAIVVLPASACGLRETARILTWLAGQTAGQCGPCVHGLAAIARGMTDLASGRSTQHDVTLLHRWAGQVEGRGACSFPDGAVRLLRSALHVFADDVDHHLFRGVCSGTTRTPVMPIPANSVTQWR
jgi:NADH:ubiquinone oxidoreductase subunit F (NADH-binding)